MQSTRIIDSAGGEKMDKIVDIITEPVPIKKENGWPICYIARFRNDCIILHSYKLNWESREYVIADDPGYAVDVSKGMIMNDHADAIGDSDHPDSVELMRMAR